MASRVVRSSKYRHVFGTVFKKEECYDELRITRSSVDSNFITANPRYFGVVFQSSGGGCFAVIPHSSTGKLLPSFPVVIGHTGEVTDINFSPFNDDLIASASDDCTCKIWKIPDGGLKENMTSPVQSLSGHKKKTGTVLFNPVASNILASTGFDLEVKIWDVEKGSGIYSVGKHGEYIHGIDWKGNGSLIATTCKDKKLRIIDPRQQSIASECEVHQGIKSSRVVWVGDKIFSTGFSKSNERQYALWDPKDLSKPLAKQDVDSSSGMLMPFYDRDTGVVFLAGKGDGNIRYYEVTSDAPYVHYLSEFKSNTPLRGCCLIPKRSVNVGNCEIARMLKVTVKSVEPISFQVPRKADLFQDDLFPDCFSGESSLTASEWQANKNAEQKTRGMADLYVKK